VPVFKVLGRKTCGISGDPRGRVGPANVACGVEATLEC
jgi:hypothetical protein